MKNPQPRQPNIAKALGVLALDRRCVTVYPFFFHLLKRLCWNTLHKGVIWVTYCW